MYNIDNGNLYNEDALQWVPNMKFDVVIGNPPYQGDKLTSKGKITGNAGALYVDFINLSKTLSNKYYSMIVPHKWIFLNKLKSFKETMFNSGELKLIKHFAEKDYVFGKGVIVKGGVSYFVCEKGYTGDLTFLSKGVSTLVANKQPIYRFNSDLSNSILAKVGTFTKNTLKIRDYGRGGGGSLTGTKDKRLHASPLPGVVGVDYFEIYCKANTTMYLSAQDLASLHLPDLEKWKLFVPIASSCNTLKDKFLVGKPLSGYNRSKAFLLVSNDVEAENLKSWLSTYLAMFLLAQVQESHNITTPILRLLPEVDLSKAWTDADTQTHFNLTDEEITYMKTCVDGFDIDKE